MRTRWGAWFSRGVTALASFWPATAFAQKPGRVPNEDAGMLPWVVAIGLLIVVCAPAAINAKRSHLD